LHGLDPSHVKAFFPTLVKVTERFARRWHRAAAASEGIDLRSDLTRYTVDVTAGLAFGSDVNTTESDEDIIQSHIEKLRAAMWKRLMAPVRYWRYVKLPSDRQLDRHLAALSKAVDGFICQARSRIERNPGLREQPSNLIEAMIAARDREGSELTDEDVAANVLTMLVAGEDTTASTLAWLIWFLCRDRGAMSRASREVRAALGDDAYPTRYDQLNELTFVEACAHEVMRLKPVAPFLTLEAARDVVVGGVALPAGTPVICLIRPGAMDGHHFSDPLVFRPERWLVRPDTPDATSSAKRIAMPFGAGPRICPGRYLALAEVKMVVAMLLGGFEVESVTTPNGCEPRERLAFSMSPADLKLRLRSRDTEKTQRAAERCPFDGAEHMPA
jgi:cytochrome P450